MIYNPRAPQVEAERVLLSEQNLYAIAVDGKAHLIPGDVFDLLFSLAPGKAAIAPPAKRVKKAHVKRSRATKRPAVAKGTREATAAGLGVTHEKVSRDLCAVSHPVEQKTWERGLSVLQKFGPLTHAEFADHLYREEPSSKKRSDCTYAVEADLRSKGLIERVEDNGLTKWAAKKA